MFSSCLSWRARAVRACRGRERVLDERGGERERARWRRGAGAIEGAEAGAGGAVLRLRRLAGVQSEVGGWERAQPRASDDEERRVAHFREVRSTLAERSPGSSYSQGDKIIVAAGRRVQPSWTPASLQPLRSRARRRELPMRALSAQARGADASGHVEPRERPARAQDDCARPARPSSRSLPASFSAAPLSLRQARPLRTLDEYCTSESPSEVGRSCRSGRTAEQEREPRTASARCTAPRLALSRARAALKVRAAQ
mgnify:CR=1 FL=1